MFKTNRDGKAQTIKQIAPYKYESPKRKLIQNENLID